MYVGNDDLIAMPDLMFVSCCPRAKNNMSGSKFEHYGQDRRRPSARHSINCAIFIMRAFAVIRAWSWLSLMDIRP